MILGHIRSETSFSLVEMSIFWAVILSVTLSTNFYMNMCPILNVFWYRGIWLYSGFGLGAQYCPSLPPCCATESVWSVSWLLWLLIVKLLECCEKCRTSSQMPNMLIWCVVPILQEARWAPGPVWTGGKSRPHRDSIPDHPARSQSLYRLS